MFPLVGSRLGHHSRKHQYWRPFRMNLPTIANQLGCLAASGIVFSVDRPT